MLSRVLSHVLSQNSEVAYNMYNVHVEFLSRVYMSRVP